MEKMGFNRGDYVEFGYSGQLLHGTLLNIYPTAEGMRIGVVLVSGEIFNTFYSHIENLRKIPKFKKLERIKIGQVVSYTVDGGWELLGLIGRVTKIGPYSIFINGRNISINDLFAISPQKCRNYRE